MRLGPVLAILPFILGLGLSLRITNFLNQFINEDSNERQLEELPGGTDQIFMVFTVALATTVINTLLSTSTPTPEKPKEEFHWCYTDSSCGENTWKDHFPVSNIYL